MIEARISVRTLIEFVLRSGDIDNRIATGSDDAMAEGARLHRAIQKRAGSDYRSEVSLSYVYSEDDCRITVEGRADGLIENESGVTIDEIKCTYGDVMRYYDAKPMHLAQAKFYAYMAMLEKELPVVKVRLTYVNIDTEETRYFNYTFLPEELEKFTSEIVHEYVKWGRLEAQWREVRNECIKGLPFPYEYRKGQDELVKQVYYTIYHKRKLFLEAPTGVGKTLATMYPAIQALGQGMGDKIFYLTAKTITRTVAAEAVKLMRDKNLKAKSIILTAKEKICMTGETECNPDACPYAKGHFDRINDAMYDILTHEDDYTREKIEEYAVKHMVCPFEFSLDVSLFSDIIICDYNYAFDPRAKLKRYFESDTANREFLFLIDEAHNLVDRAREMFSATLYKEQFTELRRMTAECLPPLSKKLDKCNKSFLELKRGCPEYIIEPETSAIMQDLLRLYSEIEKFLEAERKKNTRRADAESADDTPKFRTDVPKDVKDAILEMYFEVGFFLEISELLDDNYTVYASYDESGAFFLREYCVNPRKNLAECMGMARSSVLFSATLLPIRYYKELLAGTPEDYEVYAESIFDSRKRGLFVARDVTSKYTRRTDDEFAKIACYIHEAILQRNGNYMVFFPSYSFMEKVYKAYKESFADMDDGNTEILMQHSGMSEEEREVFLNRFKCETDETLFEGINMDVSIEEDTTLVGFCVMGGIFSEGIDLKNDSLIGAIIVGTGLPMVCLENEIIKETFNEQGDNGFDYSYKYPGMNKVLQAAGRVIRTVSDVGIVLLLDERFLERSYLAMFPREWNNYEAVSIDDVGKRIERFWDEWL